MPNDAHGEKKNENTPIYISNKREESQSRDRLISMSCFSRKSVISVLVVQHDQSRYKIGYVIDHRQCKLNMDALLHFKLPQNALGDL